MSDKFTWMHSGQLGAPQMNGAAGSNGQMLQALDACLINGFNPQTVIAATKTATTVTLTFGVSHGYELLQVISVSGATDMSLNGRHRITAKTANTITIDAVGVTGTTGTITTKVAPLGFESIFGSTDPLRRAYRSNNLQSTKTVLFLDMNLPTGHGYNATNPAKRAMISMCEDMVTLGSQINSYTDARNEYATSVNGALFWYQVRSRRKTDAVSTSINSSWVIVGNDKFFYLLTEWQDYSQRGSSLRDTYSFGDVDTLKDGFDPYSCVCICSVNDNDATDLFFTSNGAIVKGRYSTKIDYHGIMIKNIEGLSFAPAVITATGWTGENLYSGASAGLSAQTAFSNTLLTLPLFVKTGDSLRASLPRLRFINNDISTRSDLGLTVMDKGLLIKMHQGSMNRADFGAFIIDMEG